MPDTEAVCLLELMVEKVLSQLSLLVVLSSQEEDHLAVLEVLGDFLK